MTTDSAQIALRGHQAAFGIQPLFTRVGSLKIFGSDLAVVIASQFKRGMVVIPANRVALNRSGAAHQVSLETSITLSQQRGQSFVSTDTVPRAYYVQLNTTQRAVLPQLILASKFVDDEAPEYVRGRCPMVVQYGIGDSGPRPLLIICKFDTTITRRFSVGDKLYVERLGM